MSGGHFVNLLSVTLGKNKHAGTITASSFVRLIYHKQKQSATKICTLFHKESSHLPLYRKYNI